MISFKQDLFNTKEELEKSGQFFQVAIQFFPSHPPPKIIDSIFCEQVGSLLTEPLFQRFHRYKDVL